MGALDQRNIGTQLINQVGDKGCFDQQLIAILASDDDARRVVGLPFPGGLRPDLANVQTGALFEIKPINSAGDGLLQLSWNSPASLHYIKTDK